ncbi:hypothetical protein [Sphingomicrobium nitratireducens]|uniref:hypothetical protein n=1 Tax=Sphingomicrobium nitratireducens TaxID=2964666 RepID=UPI002240C18D|nr:hypothetical protein [Sphingomicrobium nitratireducens]
MTDRTPLWKSPPAVPRARRLAAIEKRIGEAEALLDHAGPHASAANLEDLRKRLIAARRELAMLQAIPAPEEIADARALLARWRGNDEAALESPPRPAHVTLPGGCPRRR